MKIVQFADQHIGDVVKLWNHACEADMEYKTFDEKGFKAKFIDNPHFSYEGSFVAIQDEQVIGFANGLYKKEFLPGETNESTPGYLTMILVDANYRNQGLGTQLLQSVEDFLRRNGKKQVQIIFFNPINLEWNVPGTENHDHPNAPGVDIDSIAYSFFLSQGYEQRTKENSYYLPLNELVINEKVKHTIQRLQDKEIFIEYYDPKKHNGFEELFNQLNNEQWRKEIIGETQKKNPRPILIVHHNGKIFGFTGPLAVQESGRGYFAGIGVHPAYGGMGIGTTLFFKLCESLKKEGAIFMTLFTGESNPARKMYERAGFGIVKSWAVLRKEL
ncbi:MAG: GNAT family N-acetyltransferase [Epulopiscium sp.]|nr:GNAT family N-acetyltransferase [Candidatus Epulonipiscium sp.]